MKKRFINILSSATICSLAMIAMNITNYSHAADLVGNSKNGAKKNAMCVGCHQIPEYKTAFPHVYRVPKIVGQNEKYIVAALKGYKTKQRYHPTMQGIAASLSDQDIADLAAFYSGKK